MGVADSLKYCGLKAVVVLIYIVSHLYDYLFYPVYFFAYHPWLVRWYKKTVHAKIETREDCVIFQSLVKPDWADEEIRENNLTTMYSIFAHVAKKNADKDCLGTREIFSEEDEVQPNGKVFKKYVMGKYTWRKFKDFQEEAENVAKGLTSLTLKEHERVAMVAETRAEWLITAYGCFINNLSLVTVYTNLGVKAMVYSLNQTEARVAFCSHETLSRVMEVSEQCHFLETVVVMGSQLANTGKRIVVEMKKRPNSRARLIPYEDLIAPKAKVDMVRPSFPSPEDCAIIMYTSGSTGLPKGVMLSHKNLVSAMNSLMKVADLRPNDRYIAYLPLAHVLELLAEATCLFFGMKIGYSSSLTLTNKSSKVKAGSKGDANVFRPTLMCAVPLILERIYKSIVDTMRRQGWAAEELFHYFMRYKMKWQDRGFDTPLLNKTLFRKIRYFLGGRVRLMLSGGAPLSPDTHSLTRTCLCVPLMQGYGLTETTASATITSRHDRTTGRSGSPVFDVRIKLVDWEEGNYLITDTPLPRGEVHVGGDNVALGYFKDTEKTEEDFYVEGGVRWFRTGDIGELHPDGVLRIVDRKKDLVKLQGGEYVSYGKVEAVLKTCPVVENVCLYADPSKDYVFGIVVPNKNALREEVAKCRPEAAGLDFTEMSANQDLRDLVASLVQSYGHKNGLEKFELPKKVLLVSDEWSPDSGHVTAAFKIKRWLIVSRYQEEMKKLYV